MQNSSSAHRQRSLPAPLPAALAASLPKVPQPSLRPDTIGVVWSADHMTYAEVFRHRTGAFTYHLTTLYFSEYYGELYWSPRGDRARLNLYDAPNQAAEAAWFALGLPGVPSCEEKK